MNFNKAVIGILLQNHIVVASWGITNISIEPTLIRFCVNGFRFRGIVEIEPYDDSNLIIHIGDDQFITTLNDVTYTLDQRIERGLDYSKDIETYLIEIVRNRRYANDKVLDKKHTAKIKGRR